MTAPEPLQRMTIPTQLVLQVLLDAAEPTHGGDITKATGLPSGTVYPILERLRQRGWLQGDWEDIDPTVAKRPKRHYVQLTAGGRAAAREALEQVPNVGLLRER